MPVSVSVIIPTYKSAQWVEETLESVLRQTYGLDSVEIIVVDDCSPDDSADVARRMLQGKPVRSQVVRHETNHGTPANRNSGWKLAQGDWIQFLDADDLLAPHKLELQARVAEQAPEDLGVIYSNWQYYEDVGGKWQPTGGLHAPIVDEDPVEQILGEFDFGYVGPTLIRKSFIAKVGGFLEKPNIGEDCDLMLRMAMAGARFRQARSESAAFLYRQWPSSLWRAYFKNPLALRNAMQTFRGAEEFLRARGSLSERARVGLGRRYSRWAEIFVEQDPPRYRELCGWLHGLGFKQPLDLSPPLQLAASTLGYHNAIKLRSLYRRLKSPQRLKDDP